MTEEDLERNLSSSVVASDCSLPTIGVSIDM